MNPEPLPAHGWLVERVQQPALAIRRLGGAHLVEDNNHIIDAVVAEGTPEAFDAARAVREGSASGKCVGIRRRDVRLRNGQPILVQPLFDRAGVVDIVFGVPFGQIERRRFNAPAGADAALSAVVGDRPRLFPCLAPAPCLRGRSP